MIRVLWWVLYALVQYVVQGVSGCERACVAFDCPSLWFMYEYEYPGGYGSCFAFA